MNNLTVWGAQIVVTGAIAGFVCALIQEIWHGKKRELRSEAKGYKQAMQDLLIAAKKIYTGTVIIEGDNVHLDASTFLGSPGAEIKGENTKITGNVFRNDLD